jgi:hypothetical protein
MEWRYVMASEAARLCGCVTSVINEARHAGEIAAFRGSYLPPMLCRSRWHYRTDDLEKWTAKRVLTGRQTRSAEVSKETLQQVANEIGLSLDDPVIAKRIARFVMKQRNMR